MAFSVGNFQALMLAQKQLIEFAALARRVAGQHTVQMSALEPFPVAEGACFYWAVVVAVCAGIFLITYQRRQREQQLSMWA